MKSKIDSVIIDMILDHYNLKSAQGKPQVLTSNEFDAIVEQAKEIYFKDIMLKTPQGTEGSA
tara:strand:+ start:183 stop:368 length:186 start_codon:yes stop_codon:yes gene_type:complete